MKNHAQERGIRTRTEREKGESGKERSQKVRLIVLKETNMSRVVYSNKTNAEKGYDCPQYVNK